MVENRRTIRAMFGLLYFLIDQTLSLQVGKTEARWQLTIQHDHLRDYTIRYLVVRTHMHLGESRTSRQLRTGSMIGG